MSFFSDPIGSIQGTLASIPQTLANPLAAKPSDVFTAIGDPLGGAITHAIDTTPGVAQASIPIASAFGNLIGLGPVAGAAQATAIGMENGSSTTAGTSSQTPVTTYSAAPALDSLNGAQLVAPVAVNQQQSNATLELMLGMAVLAFFALSKK